MNPGILLIVLSFFCLFARVDTALARGKPGSGSSSTGNPLLPRSQFRELYDYPASTRLYRGRLVSTNRIGQLFTSRYFRRGGNPPQPQRIKEIKRLWAVGGLDTLTERQANGGTGYARFGKRLTVAASENPYHSLAYTNPWFQNRQTPIPAVPILTEVRPRPRQDPVLLFSRKRSWKNFDYPEGCKREAGLLFQPPVGRTTHFLVVWPADSQIGSQHLEGRERLYPIKDPTALATIAARWKHEVRKSIDKDEKSKSSINYFAQTMMRKLIARDVTSLIQNGIVGPARQLSQ